MTHPRVTITDMENVSLPAIAKKVTDEASAYEFLEDLRWNGRPVCPHCGVIDGHYFLTPRQGSRKTRTGSATHRRVWKCHACRKQFTVLVGTIFHRTKVPVRTWVFVLADMISAKNGISAREIERKYDVTPRTAWFMAHRIREAMRAPEFTRQFSGTVEADETYVGGKLDYRRHGPRAYMGGNKTPVVTLIERESGEVRSRVMPTVNARNLGAMLAEQVTDSATLMTDQARYYRGPGRRFARHATVNHRAGEYARGDAHVNTAESFFGQFKRSLDGTFHHVSPEHLGRYVAEFDYRYNTRKMTDAQRMTALLGRVNRRLTYRPSSSEPSSGSLLAA